MSSPFPFTVLSLIYSMIFVIISPGFAAFLFLEVFVILLFVHQESKIKCTLRGRGLSLQFSKGGGRLDRVSIFRGEDFSFITKNLNGNFK